MIDKIFNTIERGVRVMGSNPRLLLVATLVFVFPLLFLWVTQNFFTTAHDNITTTEKQRVSLLHDTLSAVLQAKVEEDRVNQLLISLVDRNTELTKLRIIKSEESGFRVLYSNDLDLLQSEESPDALYSDLPASAAKDSFIFEAQLHNTRVWQAFRIVDVDESRFYIFSEHSFAVIDSVLQARKQQSYFGLTAIFIFLIALSYWINKQVDWRQKHGELGSKLDEQDIFTKTIAHEFRAPLTAIKGYAGLLLDSNEIPQTERTYASHISSSAQRLVELVNDFLEVASLQAGKITTNNEPVLVSEVIRKVIFELRPLAAKKNLALSQDADTPDVEFMTDPKRLHQILTNVVSNAIKYTETGSIKLEYREYGGDVIIKVKDTGNGIGAEDQKKLFGQFSRVGNVEKTEITGTGIGMWITRELVTLLGGSIGVESIENVGTHVVITFPKDQ